MTMHGGTGIADILIYGVIGNSFFDEDAVGAKQFVDELKEITDQNPREIHVHINSPGGSVRDGTAIFTAIQRERERTTTFIDGHAASMAAGIAMAGSKVVMAESGLMMIHNPEGAAFGDSRTMMKAANMLNKAKSAMMVAYVNKTGKTEQEISDAMDVETWFTAEDALEFGLVDEIDKALETQEEQNISNSDLRAFYELPRSSSLLEPSLAMVASAQHQGGHEMAKGNEGAPAKGGGENKGNEGAPAKGGGKGDGDGTESVEPTGVVSTTLISGGPELPSETETRDMLALHDQIRAIAPSNMNAVAEKSILAGHTLEEARTALQEAMVNGAVGTPEPTEPGEDETPEMEGVSDADVLNALTGA